MLNVQELEIEELNIYIKKIIAQLNRLKMQAVTRSLVEGGVGMCGVVTLDK